ncbi:MAG: CocE/NonD family hydrolase [Pseudomonadota bacterium]
MNEIKVITDFPRKVLEIENTWIEMPDGVKLAARIWLPEDAEADPVPAILEYLPYRKRDGTVERDHLTHPYFAGRGYAGVRVDMRGTGDSEGICLGEYLKQEQDDALAIIEWLAAQPWCSGKVGMIGISWGGFNGLQVAARRPPALGAVISLCSTDDRYADDIHFMGGCMLTDKLNWGATAFSIANTPPDPAIVGARWRDMWLERLENNGLWMLDWFRHQRRDEFYEHGSVCENYSDIEIPVYMVGGWADGYTNAIFRALEHLPGPKKGLIGPWAHKYPHFALPGPRIGFLQECLRWWDQHLKGIETGIMREPMLRAYVQDPVPPATFSDHRDGNWVAEADWQGAGVSEQSLHPHDAALASEANAGEITLNAPQNAGWTAGSWCGYGLIPDAAADQNGEAGLMTSFETAPLEEDLTLLGFPILEADVTSNSPQANLAAVLSAVDEQGRATLFSFGALNLTHRDSHSDPEPMPSGMAQKARVQLNACGQKIAKGQRLRLSLSNAYWPIIWPSQTATTLTLANIRLDLPVRPARAEDSELADFDRPESAAPLATEHHSEPHFARTRKVDFVTGTETNQRVTDTGAETHLHTGLTLQYKNSETFVIHPDDPNSATGIMRWHKSYARGDWSADVETEVVVQARGDAWRIDAKLTARDADGIVREREWHEDVPRDLV